MFRNNKIIITICVSAILLCGLFLLVFSQDDSGNDKPPVVDPNSRIPGLFSQKDSSYVSWNDLIKEKRIQFGEDGTVSGGHPSLEGTLVLPDTAKVIAKGAFQGCSGLVSIDVPNSVTSIGANAFKGCTGLQAIIIPEGVTSIEANTFENCTALKTITFNKKISFIGSGSFKNCTDLTYVVIPDAVTKVSASAFEGCTGLKRAYLGASITYLDSKAFLNCTSLETVVFPMRLSYIGSKAFDGCTVLENVKYQSDYSKWHNTTIIASGNDALTEGRITYNVNIALEKEAINALIEEMLKAEAEKK